METLSQKHELLRQLPSINDVLETEVASGWLAQHPHSLVTACIREAVDDVRAAIEADNAGRCQPAHVSTKYLLAQAARLLADRLRPHVRGVINATGIILHTGLGRAVWPACVVDSMTEDLKGYVALAVDRETGARSERDQRIEYVLRELTGAEAATVVNNNAAATMLVLAALAAEKDVIVSRGQLIEIGGAFRLPDVMAQSAARLVEVGTTNRTHLKDYADAITKETAILMRVHPSNFRVVGFTHEVPLNELVTLARAEWITVVDDLGAGALVDLEQFKLPHEPTAGESIQAGADVVLFSADKLIGASQGGIILGRKNLIDKMRRHPLARAFRPDKSCLMALERTLHLFRDVDLLRREHPLYIMLTADGETLRKRAQDLAAAIVAAVATAEVDVGDGVGYLGSGSLPTEALPTQVVRLALPSVAADELARRLRMDPACVFTRIEDDRVILDVRTMSDGQVTLVAGAIGRAAEEQGQG